LFDPRAEKGGKGKIRGGPIGQAGGRTNHAAL